METLSVVGVFLANTFVVVWGFVLIIFWINIITEPLGNTIKFYI